MREKIEYAPLKKNFSALWWITIILLVLLLTRVVGAKLQGKVPSLFGYSVVNIVSGSMGETIPKGSYILIKESDPSQIKKDDIICFYSTDPMIYGMPNTHRVLEEPIVTESGIEFVTGGDAAPISDNETAKGDRLIGVYVKTLDGLTAFLSYVSGNTMITVIICLQACTLVFIAYGTFKACGNRKSKEKE